MKGGPKSSLRPFLHRALQLFVFTHRQDRLLRVMDVFLPQIGM